MAYDLLPSLYSFLQPYPSRGILTPFPPQSFKLKFLSEHYDRLVRLADNKSLREEMTTFPLAKGMDGGVQEQDRPGLIPLLVSVDMQAL